MSDNMVRTPIQNAWINFTKKVEILLVPQIDDRPLDQYLPFRDKVLALVQSEQFLEALKQVWPPFTDQPLTQVGDVLLLELQAFTLSMEVAQTTEKAEEPKKWWRKMLDRASTVSGSVKDLLENLPSHAKNALTLFSELINLFRGKE